MKRCFEAMSHQRAGLAPLEFVLSLPLLLLVMGLMISFGVAASWKIRTHAIAREAAWRTLNLRDGNNNPTPVGWPKSATMSKSNSSPPLIQDNPFMSHSIISGPQLKEPASGHSLPVNNSLMDLSQELIKGHATITRKPTLLQGVLPAQYEFRNNHIILNGNCWQYNKMGFQHSHNNAHRTLELFSSF